MKAVKSILSLILAASLIMTAVPFVFSAADDTAFSNSDSEGTENNIFFFADSFTGYVYSGLPDDTQRDYYTDYKVNQIAVYDGFIYASVGSTVRQIAIDTKQDELFDSFDGVVDRFALWNGSLYALSDNIVTKTNILTGIRTAVISDKKIEDFWFDTAGVLSYMTDGELIYSVNLESGETDSEINFSSRFVGDIPIYDYSVNGGTSADSILLSSLQAKFPAGKYWNHMGSSSNRPNGYTSTPCDHTTYGTTYCNRPSNGYSASQCHGYAVQCGYDTTGTNCMNWTRYTDSSSVDNVKAGDVIRLNYTSTQHTIFVIAVSGDTVTFTDCNSDGHCIIRWGASKSKSTLKNQFAYLCQNPNNLGNYTPGGTGTTEYTLAFDLNDDSSSRASCSEKSRKVVSGKAYGDLPTPTREGYEFAGWYTASSGGSAVTASTKMSGNTTIYAHWNILTYTISFNANAGADSVSNLPSSQTKDYGETVTLNIKSSRTPTRNNYQFVEWNSASDGSGTVYSSTRNYTYSGNADLTLYIQWQGLPRSLFFNADGGSVSSNTKSVNYGDPYGTLPTPTRDGYKFVGWYNSDGTQVNELTIMQASSSVSLTAHWDIRQYSVTYDGNGEGVTAVPATQVKNYGTSITLTLTAPIRYGYIFKGWNTRSDGSGKDYSGTVSYSSNEDTILYAQWTPMSITVTFDANGGSPASSEKTAYYDQALGELPTPTQTGKDLTGWFTLSQDGTGVQVSSSTVVKTVAAVTYYAHWETAKYKITYIENNTDVVNLPSVQTRLYEQVGFKLSPAVPSRKGFTFSYWSTASDGSGVRYNPGDAYDENSALTLYAIWERDKYLVSFNANSGTKAPSDQYKYYDLPLTLTAEIPTRPGYTFTEWNTAANGSETVYQSGDTYTGDEPLTLYAQWDPNVYTVTFDANGGLTDAVSSEFIYDTVYGALPTAQRKGYTFNGWFTGNSEIKGTDTVKILNDTTLYASWSANSYTVSFNANGGSCNASPISITYGNEFKALPVPVKQGSIFAGWFADEGFTDRIENGTKMRYDSNITLYAAFVDTYYSVTLDPAGGSCDEIGVSVSNGSPYGELPTPTKRGFTFSGWYNSSGSRVTATTVCNLSGNQTLTAHWTADTYKVTFTGTEPTESRSITYGSKYGSLPTLSSADSVFCGWYNADGTRVTADTVYTTVGDSSLSARFASLPASTIIKFVADGKTVAEVTAGSGFTQPSVPAKAGYKGNWAAYNASSGAQIVQAVYTPVSYSVTWNYNGKSLNVSFDYGSVITTPDITAPDGYLLSGWTPEIPDTMPAENMTFEAVFRPVTYNAVFISQGKLTAAVVYDSDDTSITEPVPASKAGYTAAWQSYELKAGGVTVFAVYKPITYTATLTANGVVCGTTDFTVEDDYLNLPDVPDSSGYTGKWGAYKIVPSNITVSAVYLPNTYDITFIADGEVVSVVSYTYGDSALTEPTVPQKDWYNGAWSKYLLGAADSVSFAEYTPITYTATFKAHNYEKVISFTVESLPFVEPAVPSFMGAVGYWESYTVTNADIVVNAHYDVTTISIRNYTQSRSVDYKTSITFKSVVASPVLGGQIHWFINGEDKTPNGKPEYTVSSATNDYTVQVKYFYGGEAVSESAIENVNVDNGFFARIVAFFKGLFGSLPSITQ